MSKRVHLSGSLNRKLKLQRIEKEKLLPQINNFFFNKDVLENNSCFRKTMKSTSAETTDVSNLKLSVYNCLY
jgi:hypothetical protein